MEKNGENMRRSEKIGEGWGRMEIIEERRRR